MSNYYFREFKSILFMGASQPGTTEYNILKLKKLLDDCLIEIGGLQQPPHSESEEIAKRHEIECEQGWKKVRDMVKDIAMALTGEEIRFPCDIEQDNKEWEKAIINSDPYHDEEDDFGEQEDENDFDFDDEDVEHKKGTVLDALGVLGERMIGALDKQMLDKNNGQWWLARAKRIVREALKNE